jgi:hypothetical protein
MTWRSPAPANAQADVQPPDSALLTLASSSSVYGGLWNERRRVVDRRYARLRPASSGLCWRSFDAADRRVGSAVEVRGGWVRIARWTGRWRFPCFKSRVLHGRQRTCGWTTRQSGPDPDLWGLAGAGAGRLRPRSGLSRGQEFARRSGRLLSGRAQRVDECLTSLDAELLVGGSQVGLHRLDADEQLLSDGAVCLA